MTSPRPTVAEFRAGTLYGVRQVARLFGRTDQWVRNQITAGRLSAAKLDGCGPWLVGGESVRALYGALGLPADAAPAADAQPQTPVAARTRRGAARLAALNRRSAT